MKNDNLYISTKEVLEVAKKLNLWFASHGKDPRRHLMYLRERRLIPKREAMWDKTNNKVKWAYPYYIVKCLEFYADKATYPYIEIKEMLQPLIKKWHEEWEKQKEKRR